MGLESDETVAVVYPTVRGEEVPLNTSAQHLVRESSALLQTIPWPHVLPPTQEQTANGAMIYSGNALHRIRQFSDLKQNLKSEAQMR